MIRKQFKLYVKINKIAIFSYLLLTSFDIDINKT